MTNIVLDGIEIPVDSSGKYFSKPHFIALINKRRALFGKALFNITNYLKTKKVAELEQSLGEPIIKGGEWIHGAAMLEIIRKTDTQLWLDILQDASAMEVLNG